VLIPSSISKHEDTRQIPKTDEFGKLLGQQAMTMMSEHERFRNGFSSTKQWGIFIDNMAMDGIRDACRAQIVADAGKNTATNAISFDLQDCAMSIWTRGILRTKTKSTTTSAA